MPSPDDWSTAVNTALDARHITGRFRSRRPVEIIDATHVRIAGRTVVNFASNDYLGLSHHPRVTAAFAKAAATSAGSGAAALVSGHTTDHARAEARIARWKSTESAVLLSSGYAANVAAVQAIAAVAGDKPLRFLVDKLVHASLIDAVRGVLSATASMRVFPHNGLPKLRRLLEGADPNGLDVVVTESIFSMDGDAADLAGIAKLKQEFPFLVLLDEAHGSGVYGPGGSGYAAEIGLASSDRGTGVSPVPDGTRHEREARADGGTEFQPVGISDAQNTGWEPVPLAALADLTVVTLSKAVGVVGGAVCASAQWCDAVVNFGRPYVFSTSLPPAVAAAAVESIDVMADEPERQARVRKIAVDVRRALTCAGMNIPAGDSPIVPVILGDESRTLAAAEQLLASGYLVGAIRPPTVPVGASRLRITLSCEHTDTEIAGLISELQTRFSGGPEGRAGRASHTAPPGPTSLGSHRSLPRHTWRKGGVNPGVNPALRLSCGHTDAEIARLISGLRTRFSGGPEGRAGRAFTTEPPGPPGRR